MPWAPNVAWAGVFLFSTPETRNPTPGTLLLSSAPSTFFHVSCPRAAALGDASLEGEGRAFGVGRGRGGVAEEGAEVEEVLLRGGALGEVDLAPLANEVGRRHVAGASRGCGEARRFSPVVLVLVLVVVLDLRLSG